MMIHVKVKPNSSKNEVENLGEDRYLVYLKETPENNKANLALIKILSKKLGVSQKSLEIKFGKTSHEKLVEIKY